MARAEAENGQWDILLQLRHDFCPLSLDSITWSLAIVFPGRYTLHVSGIRRLLK
jgi:hypothetical protein